MQMLTHIRILAMYTDMPCFQSLSFTLLSMLQLSMRDHTQFNSHAILMTKWQQVGNVGVCTA